MLVDYDEHDRVIGIELLYPSKCAPDLDRNRLVFETVLKSG